jgi:hypothetical protein
MAEELLARLVNERGIVPVPRGSVMEALCCRGRTTANGHDATKIVQDTLELGAQGHMRCRTVHLVPQINAQFSQAMERIIPGQMGAREACRRAQQNAIADLRRAGLSFREAGSARGRGHTGSRMIQDTPSAPARSLPILDAKEARPRRKGS